MSNESLQPSLWHAIGIPKLRLEVDQVAAAGSHWQESLKPFFGFKFGATVTT
jgi:hypothetical protein